MVRDDLPLGRAAAQIVHAAVTLQPDFDAVVVLLTAPLHHLFDICEQATTGPSWHERFASWREPDLKNQLTAVAWFPREDEFDRFLRHLPRFAEGR